MTQQPDTADVVRGETFEYSVDDTDRYTIMVVETLSAHQGPLRAVGYSEKNLLYGYYNGAEWKMTHDLYKFDRWFTAADDDTLFDFLLQFHTGERSFDELEDITTLCHDGEEL